MRSSRTLKKSRKHTFRKLLRGRAKVRILVMPEDDITDDITLPFTGEVEILGRIYVLVVKTPEQIAGREFVVSKENIILGRAYTSDILVPDMTVSKKHATLNPKPDGVEVIDLCSKNGVYIGKRRVKRHILKAGEEIRFGRVIMRLDIRTPKEHSEKQAIYNLAFYDPLTNLYNRRYLDEKLDELVVADMPFSFLILDVDDFKMINDTYGHKFGDEVLRRIGASVKACIRGDDIAARYGGEEIAVILVNANKSIAAKIAERIRETVQKLQFGIPRFKVTISCGIASFPSDGNDGTDIVNFADSALYKAKSMGKNRTVTA